MALRSGFVALFAASTWLMWRIAARWYGPRAGFFAALALNLTGYYGLAASTFAFPDGPLLFFWLLTIDRLSVALEQPRKTLPWVWVGLAWGGAMLSKYHANLLAGGHALVLDPARVAAAMPGQTGAVPGSRAWDPGLQPGSHLERQPRLGFISVSGRQGRGRLCPGLITWQPLFWRKQDIFSLGSGYHSSC